MVCILVKVHVWNDENSSTTQRPMALATSSDLRALIPTLLQSTTGAYGTLATGILALGKFQKATELLENVICNLKEEHNKYDDLVKVLTSLATQYKKLDIETKCHLRTVKEQAEVNAKIIDEAKKQLLKGNEFTSFIVEVEQSAQYSLKSSEELRTKYDVVINNIKDCCSQAKAGYERNEQKANVADKAGRVGLLGGAGVGGSFAAFQIATKALCVFGVPGAVAGGVLGLVGGGILGGMASGIPFATAEALFRNYAEKFKILDDTLTQVDQILLENFEVFTEICRLLNKLKKVAKSLSEAKVDDGSSVESSKLDHTNIDFLISLRFDEFKRASDNLEKNCQYMLDDIPLKSLGRLPFNEKEKMFKAKGV